MSSSKSKNEDEDEDEEKEADDDEKEKEERELKLPAEEENIYETLITKVIKMFKEDAMYTIKQFKESIDTYEKFTFILCITDNANYITYSNKDSSPYISSRVIITIREDMVDSGHQTRSSTQVDATIFYINQVFTHSSERGKGLATLLLIYGMCNVKVNYENINIFVLDDCSGRRHYMRNVYTNLGFVFQGTISLDKTKSSKITSSCSEKQLNLISSNDVKLFKIRAMKRLTNIETKLNTAGIKKNKKQKTKNTKKNKKTKNKKTKTQKNKKNTKKTQKKHKKNTKKTQKKQKKQNN